MKKGDKLTIHCYKHNGKIDRISGEAVILDETEDYLVCANNKVKLTENDGRSHRTKEIAILFFYKKNWYNILAQLKKFGLFYYCNIASPYIIDGNIIKYIDYYQHICWMVKEHNFKYRLKAEKHIKKHFLVEDKQPSKLNAI